MTKSAYDREYTEAEHFWAGAKIRRLQTEMANEVLSGHSGVCEFHRDDMLDLLWRTANLLRFEADYELETLQCCKVHALKSVLRIPRKT